MWTVHADGTPRGILANPELMPVIGSFPLTSLAAFPGTGIDHATVTELLKLA